MANDKKPIGFAKMTPAERSAAARKGALAAGAAGRAYRWTPETALEASKKSVRVRAEKRLDAKLAQQQRNMK